VEVWQVSNLRPLRTSEEKRRKKKKPQRKNITASPNGFNFLATVKRFLSLSLYFLTFCVADDDWRGAYRKISNFYKELLAF